MPAKSRKQEKKKKIHPTTVSDAGQQAGQDHILSMKGTKHREPNNVPGFLPGGHFHTVGAGKGHCMQPSESPKIRRSPRGSNLWGGVLKRRELHRKFQNWLGILLSLS